MGTAQLQADIIGLIIDASFWTSAVFVPVVSLYWPWWRHPYARAAMSIDILLAMAFLPAELRRVLGIPVSSPLFGWFEIVILGLIPVRTAWLGWQIWKVQREPRPSAGAKEEVRT